MGEMRWSSRAEPALESALHCSGSRTNSWDQYSGLPPSTCVKYLCPGKLLYRVRMELWVRSQECWEGRQYENHCLFEDWAVSEAEVGCLCALFQVCCCYCISDTDQQKWCCGTVRDHSVGNYCCNSRDQV